VIPALKEDLGPRLALNKKHKTLFEKITKAKKDLVGGDGGGGSSGRAPA
jgi:hypothetical protein